MRTRDIAINICVLLFFLVLLMLYLVVAYKNKLKKTQVIRKIIEEQNRPPIKIGSTPIKSI